MIIGGYRLAAAVATAVIGCSSATIGHAAGLDAEQPSCMTLTRAVPRGTILGARDAAPAPCPAIAAAQPLRYDAATRTLRAGRDLSAGETLPAPPFALPDIRPGDTLALVERIGAVTVERQVVALQAGRAGAPLFVKAADGAVFAATFPEVAP